VIGYTIPLSVGSTLKDGIDPLKGPFVISHPENTAGLIGPPDDDPPPPPPPPQPIREKEMRPERSKKERAKRKFTFFFFLLPI
jgi:hypothetical protein